jgi:Na+/H+ antiporter NhaD/arsenite permease-like protein
LLFTQSAPGETVWHAIYESTVGHQEAQNAYGSSTFSFWSTQPKLADLWQRQLIPGQYLLRPSVNIFAAFIIATFFIARRRSQVQLAALTAAIAIAVQLWKSHAGGSYVEWYYPFFLIGLFCTGQALHQPGLDGEVKQQGEAA